MTDDIERTIREALHLQEGEGWGQNLPTKNEVLNAILAVARPMPATPDIVGLQRKLVFLADAGFATGVASAMKARASEDHYRLRQNELIAEILGAVEARHADR